MSKIPKIDIKGVIVSNDDAWIYDWLEWEHTSPAKVTTAIAEANGEPLEVYINSPGGDVYAGSEIYAALMEYKGDSVGKIVGVAASAAGVAAMGVKRLLIAPTAQIMIHNVSSIAWGDHRDMQHEADVLKGWNKSIANAYRIKSGLEESELLSMMNKETWLTAQEAKEKGFVDEIMFDEGRRLAATASGLLPPEVVAKLRNELMQQRLSGHPNEPMNPQPIVSQGQAAKRSVSFYAKKLSLKREM